MNEAAPIATGDAARRRRHLAHRFWRAFGRAFRVYSRIFPFLFFGLFLPMQLARTDIDRDAIAYYGAKLRAESDTASLYTPYPPNRAHDPKDGYPFYLYPPPLAAAFALLPDMEFARFARIMFLLCTAGYWVLAAGVGKIATGRVSLDTTLIVGAALFLWPDTNATLQLCNVDVLLWAAAAWAVASRPARGALLAGIAAIKTFGVWPLAAWVVRSPRSALVSAAVAVVPITLVSAAVLGPNRLIQSSFEWAEHVAPALAQGQFVSGRGTVTFAGSEQREVKGILPENLSISFAPIQVAARLGYIDPERTLPTGVRLYLLITLVSAALLTSVLTRRVDPALQTALVLAVAVLFGPTVRGSYVHYVLPAAILLVQKRTARLSGREIHRRDHLNGH